LTGRRLRGLQAGVPSDPGAASRKRAVPVLVITLAQFVAVVSTSSVSVALPTIGRSLRASSTWPEWIVDAYVIVYASLSGLLVHCNH
jgi:MFS family permease